MQGRLGVSRPARKQVPASTCPLVSTPQGPHVCTAPKSTHPVRHLEHEPGEKNGPETSTCIPGLSTCVRISSRCLIACLTWDSVLHTVYTAGMERSIEDVSQWTIWDSSSPVSPTSGPAGQRPNDLARSRRCSDHLRQKYVHQRKLA